MPANTIHHFAARYEVSGQTIDVYVAPDVPAFRSDDDVEVADAVSWSVVPCDIVLERSTPGSRVRVARAFGEDYVLYVADLEDESMVCRFAVQFVATFEFFLDALGHREQNAWENPEAVRDRVIPQFPGVLDLTG